MSSLGHDNIFLFEALKPNLNFFIQMLFQIITHTNVISPTTQNNNKNHPNYSKKYEQKKTHK